MTIHDTIRTLAARPDSDGPFLTLYLDTNRGDGQQNERIRLLMKQEIQSARGALGTSPAGEETVEEGVQLIESFLTDRVAPETRGVAVFSAPKEDLFIPIELPMPVEPKLSIGSRPHLKMLLETFHRHPHLLVTLVDGKSARFLELELGSIVEEVSISDPNVPAKTDQGGWSQANIKRHIQDHINHHHKEVAERLTRMFDRRGEIDVILSGQERNLANFRGYLPKRVSDRIVGVLHLDIRTPSEDVARAGEQLWKETRTRMLEERLMELAAEARRNGRGALGLTKVVEAANEKKIEELVLGPKASGRGWKCTSCGVMGETVPLGCPTCGAAVVAVDLVEELVAAAHQGDASIGFAGEGSILDDYRGVGAFLRF